MSGDPEQEYFSDGISEDIITDLSNIGGLMVISRNSSFTYKGRSVDIRASAGDLGVRSVLEGSIRRAGNRVRITAQALTYELRGRICRRVESHSRSGFRDPRRDRALSVWSGKIVF